jgi:enoyl-[acyl-carrier protein] reductase/trans-2-enoyl-CoA reductase (NAD+)
MMQMVVQPKNKGPIFITSHPGGCALNVKQQISYVKDHAPVAGPKRVLIIGASTGYGLASRIVSAFGGGAQTIGVFFERPATAKRTASAGWYNSATFEEEAKALGLYAKSINGDAFSDEIKQQTIALIQEDWGGEVDLVIYSLASPRRTDPDTGTSYSSTLKPIGQSYCNKTINVMSGEVSMAELPPASEDEIAATIKVMGGEDWQRWIQSMLDADVLAKGAITLAYSYIGPALTYAIYREGTIGKAKEDLENTRHSIDNMMQQRVQGAAYVSVNKGLVTQASAAIPVVPLYFSLLFKVMKQKQQHENCIEQIYRLFADRLYSPEDIPKDDKSRIRIDDLEMDQDTQTQVATLWQQVNTDNIDQISDLEGYRHDLFKLFGFGFDDIDYTEAVEIDCNIHSIQE